MQQAVAPPFKEVTDNPSFGHSREENGKLFCPKRQVLRVWWHKALCFYASFYKMEIVLGALIGIMRSCWKFLERALWHISSVYSVWGGQGRVGWAVILLVVCLGNLGKTLQVSRNVDGTLMFIPPSLIHALKTLAVLPRKIWRLGVSLLKPG